MDEHLVKNILNVIKTSNDKNVIFKALVKLRTDLVKDRAGIVLFRKCGGIITVVKLLNRPYEKILEVALSILGNACTEDESCSEAIDNKIISPLITILKSIPNPLVQCRACRLLGNLARENKNKLLTQSSAISQSLCLILEESSEIQTLIMASRAVRLLSTEKQFLKNFIKYDGFKIIMKILIKHIKNNDPTIKNPDTKEIPNKPVGLKSSQPREKYFEEVARHLEGVRSDIFDYEMLKKNKTRNFEFIMPEDKAILDLVNEILRCVQIISEVQSFVPVNELYTAGNGLSGLVFFADEDNQYRSMTLKILSNFSKNPGTIAVLSAADAVSAACDLITTKDLKKPLTESETRHCLNIICLLAGDACNRAKIRHSGALKELVERAKISTNYSEISLILYALNNFQYDHLSMDLLLRSGLVGILIQELDAYLNGDDKERQEKCAEKKRSSKKRKNESTLERSHKNQKIIGVQSPKVCSEFFEPDSPPVLSPTSVYPSSSCSSRSLSPINSLNYETGNDFDSDIYSPVCSDDEDMNPDNKESDSDVMKLLAICNKIETNIEENLSDKEEDDEMTVDSSTTVKSTNSTIDIIDNLLLRISLQLKNRSELSKPETLKIIVQAINAFGITYNSFTTSLCNILSGSEFFVSILKQDVIHQIYKMTLIEELKPGGESFLDTLMCVGESGYGRGELTRLLMKGEQNVQKRAAIAVAFVIRTPKILYQFLTENGAIYILLNSILNKDDEYRYEAADGITSLSQAIGITLPQNDLNEFNCEREFDETIDFSFHNDNVSDENIIKFILHRGFSKIPIKFNKKLLTDNSEVFNSMLNSDFRESNEKEIHLRDYSVNGIKYFLNLINLLSENKLPNIPPIYHFDSILEAYELSRMYILENLERKLFTLIIYRLNEKTCLKIFDWALKNFNPELSEITINYYLCSNLSSVDKVQLFREADYSKNSKEWNQMIIDAILFKCQNNEC